jgi:prevent-host-death family protein
MAERFSISQARDKLTSLVRRVEAKSPIGLTSRGKTVVVLMSAADYQTFRVAIDLEEVKLTAEDLADLRDRASGREWRPEL